MELNYRTYQKLPILKKKKINMVKQKGLNNNK